MDEAIELGLRSVKFTGGEPLLIRDTTYKLMCYLRDRNVRVNMETNGTLLDDEVARFFAETKGSFISVSLDGPDNQTHDIFRGVAGSFERTLEGMDTLARKGVKYQIICAVYPGNVYSVKEMLCLARDRKAASMRYLPVSHMGRGGGMIRRGEALALEETLAFLRYIQNQIAPNSTIPVNTNVPPALASWRYLKGHGRFHSCGLPQMCGFLADGTLALCGIGEHRHDTTYGSAVNKPLKDVWRSSPQLVVHRRVLDGPMKGICGICAFRRLCNGQCRAASLDEYGRMDAPYPTCQGAYEKGLFPEKRIVGDRAIADEWIEERKVGSGVDKLSKHNEKHNEEVS